MRQIILLLFGFIANFVGHSVSYDGFERDEGVVVLKSDNFQKAIDHFDSVLVEFYAPWCGHDGPFAPDYSKLATTLREKGQNVTCARVDGLRERKLIEKYDIQTLPALKLFRNKQRNRRRKPLPDHGGSRKTLFERVIKAEVHKFNRELFSRLESIVSKKYFRFVKVNLNKKCNLSWCSSDDVCANRHCAVEEVDPSECPDYDDEKPSARDSSLARVNTDLDKIDRDQLDLLAKFECNDNDDHDAQYVDLLKNPERYTGYQGDSANRIWRAIYEENCFVRRSSPAFSDDLCYEERLFYEAISGLHSSITIHLCAEYPSAKNSSKFEPNLALFLKRFDGHSDYIENLYNLFLLELRALLDSEPYLLEKIDHWKDSSITSDIQGLLDVVRKFKIPHFNHLFLKPNYVSHELANHFHNITTNIIDCVACAKCKLWGKVQLRGLGTAFKVLSAKDKIDLSLNDQEVVTLINSIARLSHSIKQLDKFRELAVKPPNKKSDKPNQKSILGFVK